MKILSFDIGIVNLAYCVVDDDKRIHHWENIALCNGTEIENTMDLIRKMDERPDVLDVDLVLLEWQPKMNPKMKVMAEAVRGYLICRGLVDKEKNFKMKNYSAKHKLKCYEGTMPEELVASPEMLADKTRSGLNKMYRLRKKQSIYHCTMIINNTQEESIKKIFEKEKKKDDLADSFLQALSYIMYEHNKKGTGPIIQRKPTKKQQRYKKYSKNNLKFMLMEFLSSLGKERPLDKFEESPKRRTIDEVLREWVDRKDIVKNVKRLYGAMYDMDEIKKDLVMDCFVDRDFS